MEKALNFVYELGKEGKVLLFIGTKKQAQEIIKKNAQDCCMPYVNKKWLGGTFTNFSELHKLIRKYLDLKDKQARGELAKYTKKEQGKFAKDIEKMENNVGGISTLTRLPDAVFIIDLKREQTASEEASRKEVPIVAICDTNVDPDKVKYPIPANDDATKSIELITRLVAEAYLEGKAEAEAQKAAPTIEKKPTGSESNKND
jgi:small subunit ribosomal protein S2